MVNSIGVDPIPDWRDAQCTECQVHPATGPDYLCTGCRHYLHGDTTETSLSEGINLFRLSEKHRPHHASGMYHMTCEGGASGNTRCGIPYFDRMVEETRPPKATPRNVCRKCTGTSGWDMSPNEYDDLLHSFNVFFGYEA